MWTTTAEDPSTRTRHVPGLTSSIMTRHPEEYCSTLTPGIDPVTSEPSGVERFTPTGRMALRNMKSLVTVESTSIYSSMEDGPNRRRSFMR